MVRMQFEIPRPKILVIRFRFMGDVLLVTPVLRVLRERFPQGHIALLTDAPAHEVVEGHPALDELIVFNRAQDAQRSIWARAARAWSVLRDIRRRRFDLILNLHPHGNRSGWVTWFSGARWRVGYDRPGSSTWYYNAKAPYQPDGRYRVEHLLDALRVIGIEAKAELPSVALADSDRAFADAFFERDPRPVVVVHPGRANTRRAWPVERYASVADALVRDRGARIVFIGIPSEAERVRAIMAAMSSSAESLLGVASVKQVAAVMQRARLFIGMDSSPMHLASAVGLPSVSLYGYHAPQGWNPPGEQYIAFHKPVPGKPCHPPECCEPGQSPCMQNISVDEVLRAARQLIDQGRGRA